MTFTPKEAYERHKKRTREYQRTKGRINVKARTNAFKILIKNHRKEFDKLVKNLKEELRNSEGT